MEQSPVLYASEGIGLHLQVLKLLLRCVSAGQLVTRCPAAGLWSRNLDHGAAQPRVRRSVTGNWQNSIAERYSDFHHLT